ncbi:MAG: hypothetical protein M3Y26_04560 [Actinomycetota bacterium]|nr:hypothetical protein [Actinomycetota bacterium]
MSVVTTVSPGPPSTDVTPAGGQPPADMLNPAVTQATITTTICVSGYTKTIRPPQSYTGPLKVHQITTYGYADTSTGSYEEDHAIALEVGGAPSAPANLWPEPHAASGPDDTLENTLKAQVCSGALTLADAQSQLFAAKVAHGYHREKSVA